MTQQEYEEALKTRPALQEIEKILGHSVPPIKKMELFWYVQKLTGEVVRRVIQDMTKFGPETL
jgi:hypothetical protein